MKSALLTGNGQHPRIIQLIFAGMKTEQVGIRGREAQFQVIPQGGAGSGHNSLMVPLPLMRQVRNQPFLGVSQLWGNPVQLHLGMVVTPVLQPFADTLQAGEFLLQIVQVLLAYIAPLMVQLERFAFEISDQEGIEVALLTQCLERRCLQQLGRFFRQWLARQLIALLLEFEHGHLAPVAPTAVLTQITGQAGNVCQHLLPVLFRQRHSNAPLSHLGILEIRVNGSNHLLTIGHIVFCRPDGYALVDA